MGDVGLEGKEKIHAGFVQWDFEGSSGHPSKKMVEKLLRKKFWKEQHWQLSRGCYL